jgi:signal transduction histidine kinase
MGVLSVVRDASQAFDRGDFALLTSIAGEVGVAVENAQLYQQAERLAVVRERERLSRELHDSVTQSLYSLVLLAEAGRRWAERGEHGRTEEYLERVGEIGQQALREMRLLVYELRPLVLRREGLVGAIQQRLDAVEKRAGIDATLVIQGQLDISADLEEGLYRIAQEALNNALKHAAASNVYVRIYADAECVALQVEDNGKGFETDTADRGGGLGLASMRQRAEKLGGTVTVTSCQGEGTTLEVRMKRDVDESGGGTR